MSPSQCRFLLFRVSFSPATTPLFLSDFGAEMTFLERVQNTIGYVKWFIITPTGLLFDNDAVARFAPEKPYLPLYELEAKAEV
jgi:hypothetical protein